MVALIIRRCVRAMEATMKSARSVEEDGVSTVLLNGSPCGRREDQVGMLSESSHIATGPLKQK